MRAAALLVALGVALVPATAGAQAPSPPLTEGAEVLASTLVCTGDLAAPGPDPVLLVHGTAIDPSEFAWNYVPALGADRAVCTVDLGSSAMGDIQASGERVVNAIRTMHAAAGRRIDVIGHSQGGMVPRFALRYFPDTRAMVDDLVGLAASNHGSVDADGLCLVACAASIQQQRTTSAFLAALNDGFETVAEVDYTSVYTRLDEVVIPNLDAATGSTSLRTGPGDRINVATQDVCPLSLADHITIGTSDPVAWALALDALDHDGPADPARVPADTCTQVFMPGVDPATFVTDIAAVGALIAQSLAGAPPLTAEPPLRCYVTATCPSPSVVADPTASDGSSSAPAAATTNATGAARGALADTGGAVASGSAAALLAAALLLRRRRSR